MATRKNDHVRVGNASNLHYTTRRRSQASRGRASSHTTSRAGSHPQGASPILPARTAKRYSATQRVEREAAFRRRVRDQRNHPNKPLFTAIIVCVVALVALCVWFFALREVTITVNGEPYTTRVGTSLEQFLDDNNQFGAVAGRLLSVTGNVISEDGGNPSTVTYNGEELSADETAQTKVHNGDTIEVADGTDAEEPSTTETVSIAPGIEKEEGGAVQYVSQWGKAGQKTVTTGETSGETVEEVTEEAVDMVVSSINPSPSDGKKYIALTFDDGPSSYTSQVLDILAEKGVKATFFNLGSSAENYPDECKAIVDAGHELASHTMAHQNLPDMDRDSLRAEITNAASVLKDASGVETQMIRAPYGAFTDVEWARAGDLISCNVLWNIDTLDWELPGADGIAECVLSKAFNGAIVLMHDGGGDRSETVEALPDIIDGLLDDGYELVTVSELLELDGRVPDDVINGTVTMPDDAVLPDV